MVTLINSVQNLIETENILKFDVQIENNSYKLKDKLQKLNMFSFKINNCANEHSEASNQLFSILMNSKSVVKYDIKTKQGIDGYAELNTDKIYENFSYIEQLFDNCLVISGGRVESKEDSVQLSFVDYHWNTMEYQLIYSRSRHRT